MTAKRISVITPVFNAEKWIAETIHSVASFGKSHNIEHVVVDDGSTDASKSIMESFRSQIVLISTENRGEAHAVNLALSFASGDIALVVNADDPLFTERIFDGVLDFFDRNPKLVALYSDWQIINANNEVLEVRKPGSFSELELIGNMNCLPGPGTFFRTDKARMIGGRRSKWKYVSDYDFWLRLSQVGDFAYREDVLAQWRHHEASTSILQRGKEMGLERIGVIREFFLDHEKPNSLENLALSTAFYSAARLCFFSSTVPGKKWLLMSFLIGKRFPKQATFMSVVFIMLTPISRLVVSSIKSSRASVMKFRKA